MLDYEGAQIETAERFADLAKLAKLRRQDFNLTSADDALHLRKFEAAANASERLNGFATEYLSLEVQKRPGDPGRTLEPELQRRFEEVGAILDRHVDQGSGMADKRRAVLEKAEAYATAHPDDEYSDEDIAADLNKRLQRPARALDLRNRRIERTAPEPRFSGALGRGFEPGEARQFVEAFRRLHGSLNERARQMDHFFDEVNGARRDDVRAFRNHPALGQEIDRLEDAVRNGMGRMAEEWGQNALGRIDKRVEERSQRAQAAAEADSFLDSSRGSSPPAVAGVRRRREDMSTESASSGEERPARRRRLNGARAPDFRIHEDGPDGEEQANRRLAQDQARAGAAARESQDENSPPGPAETPSPGRRPREPLGDVSRENERSQRGGGLGL